MSEKKSVKEFKKQNKIKHVTSESLVNALKDQGYTIIEFNGIDDNKDVKLLVTALGVSDYIASCRCFTYQDDKYRLIFINENLNEEERTIVLAHEEGHIWNGHMTKQNVFGEEVKQEYQANEFAHYLLKDRDNKKKKLTWSFVSVGLVLILAGVGGWYLKYNHDKAIYTDNLYKSETGSKYHLEDCKSIKNRNNYSRLTKEEFESGEYEPCEVCLPDHVR